MNARRSISKVLAVPLAVGLMCVAAISTALAQSSTLDGLSANGRVAASPSSFWFGQVTRDGICGLISGCVSSSGADPNWIFTVAVDTPTGTQNIDVTVATVTSQPFSGARFHLEFASAVGSLAGDVVLALNPSGSDTEVTVRLEQMVATGFATGALDSFRQTLQPYLSSRLGILDREQSEAGTIARLTLGGGRTAVARVQVSGSSLTEAPPRATGLLRVIVDRKIVCTTVVRNSRGACGFAAPRRGTPVVAVVTGQFSNGYPIWTSAGGRYRP